MSLQGKKNVLAIQRVGWKLLKKWGVIDLRKKGQTIQENYKNVIRLYRKKIKMAKALLEFNLSPVIKDNKKIVFANTSATGGRQRRISILYWMAWMGQGHPG